MSSTPTSEQFLNAFFEAYKRSRDIFTMETWQEVWTKKWNEFILWKNGKPPEPLDKSVLHQTAGKLNLEYWEGEPLKLDSAFYARESAPVGNLPFPILVALEHENDHRGFNHEIAKLLSIRCPLKVGITYTLLWGATNTAEGRQSTLDLIRQEVCESSARISQVISEDPKTQYLFLVGCEESPLSLGWYALHFSGGQSPTGTEFRLVQGA